MLCRLEKVFCGRKRRTYYCEFASYAVIWCTVTNDDVSEGNVKYFKPRVLILYFCF